MTTAVQVSVQPVHQSTVVHQPVPITQPIPMAPDAGSLLVCSKDGHRAWTSEILGCFEDFATMFQTYLFLNCTVCEISSRLGDHPMMPYLVPGGMIALRARLRTLGGIKGSVCGDCLALTFCGLCTVCQMHRELKAMGI